MKESYLLLGFGFLGQFVFFMRFVVQWLESEKQKKSVIPEAFWYISIAGSVMIFIYSVIKKDIVFSLASFLNILMYVRNVMLIQRHKRIKPELGE